MNMTIDKQLDLISLLSYVYPDISVKMFARICQGSVLDFPSRRSMYQFAADLRASNIDYRVQIYPAKGGKGKVPSAPRERTEWTISLYVPYQKAAYWLNEVRLTDEDSYELLELIGLSYK
jgi:hypothetical protein